MALRRCQQQSARGIRGRSEQSRTTSPALSRFLENDPRPIEAIRVGSRCQQRLFHCRNLSSVSHYSENGRKSAFMNDRDSGVRSITTSKIEGESMYKFEAVIGGYRVTKRGKVLGVIRPSTEEGGRHCFVLACDKSKVKRTYRGKDMAAKALDKIASLVKKAKRGGWSRERLITAAWNQKPIGSKQW